MISEYLCSYKCDNGMWALYNSLYFDPVFVNETEYKTIIEENVSDEVIDIMRQHKIYASVSEDEDRWNLLKKADLDYGGIVDVLYIVLTLGCNLRCKYCMVEKGGYSADKMSMDVLLQTLKLYKEYMDDRGIKRGKIIFYGGEPLLDENLFLSAVKVIKDTGINCSIGMVTNGTLLSDSVIECIKKNKISVSVSIDGPKNINDKNRVEINGTGTYDDIMQAVVKLRDNNIMYGISICCNPDFADYIDSIKSWITDEHIGENFNINLYHYSGFDHNWKENCIHQTEALMDFYTYCRKNHLYEEKMARRIKAAISGEPVLSECAARGENQLVIFPSGAVGVCHVRRDKENDLPYIQDAGSLAEIIDNKALSIWRDRTIFKNDKCKGCEAVFLCGGGCYMQKEIMGFDENDESFCIYVKEYAKWLLNEMSGETNV